MDPYETPPENFEDLPLIPLSCGEHFAISCGFPIMNECPDCSNKGENDGTAGHSKLASHYRSGLWTEIRCEITGIHLEEGLNKLEPWLTLSNCFKYNGSAATISLPASQLPNAKIGDQIRLTIEVDAPGNAEES